MANATAQTLAPVALGKDDPGYPHTYPALMSLVHTSSATGLRNFAPWIGSNGDIEDSEDFVQSQTMSVPL